MRRLTPCCRLDSLACLPNRRIGSNDRPERTDRRAWDRFLDSRLRALAQQASERRDRVAWKAVKNNFKFLSHLDLPGGSPHADVFFYDHDRDVGGSPYVGT